MRRIAVLVVVCGLIAPAGALAGRGGGGAAPGTASSGSPSGSSSAPSGGQTTTTTSGSTQGSSQGSQGSSSSASSGSLAVDSANGTIFVQGQGVIYGYVDQGSLLVLSYRPTDPSATISVENARVRSGSGLTSYTGSGVRFLLPAGRYSLELVGSGIDVSAVGSGVVNASGAGAGSGSIAFNGGDQLSLDRIGSPRSFGTSGP